MYEPGSLIVYGSYGTALAGHLLEQVSGNRFADHMAASLFEMLDMRHSTCEQVLPAEYQEDIAVIYSYEEHTASFVPTPFLHLNTPSTGGLSATPLDMAHFAIALLNDGRYKDTQVLSPTSAQAMLDQQYTPYPDFPGVTCGFMEHFYNNQRGLIRDGSGLRTRAQVYLLPEHNLGYVYVQNTSGDEVIDELGVYATYFKQIAAHPAVAFGVSPLAVAMLGVLLCGAILGLTPPVFAFLAWKDRYWSVWGRIHYTVLAVAALAFVWWLNYWNLLGFRYQIAG